VRPVLEEFALDDQRRHQAGFVTRVARGLFALLLWSVAVAACGSGSHTSASTGSRSSSSSAAGSTTGVAAGVDRAHQCSIASLQQLSNLVGATLTRTEESSSSCQYFDATGSVVVALDVEFTGGRSAYEAASGPQVTDVDGAGDSAFRIKGVPSGTDFDAVKGDVYLNLFVADASIDNGTLARIASFVFQQVGA
jgi:hypothetical protein